MTTSALTGAGHGPVPQRGGMPRWPLFLIAAPAAVAVWSGWVGLGGLCGFGVIHPLPGIAGTFRLNTAITLPIGVESYGAYALGAWLTPGTPAAARQFARRSAIAALALGMAGQIIYHLLAAAHVTRAPWPIVAFVSCLPVASLGLGAALAHLLRTDAAPAGRTDTPHGASDAPGQARTGEVPHSDGRTGQHDRTGPGPRQVGAVDRDAIVAELAAEILAAAAAGEKWRPDYAALMARTGFKRSWCEKAVRDARTAVFRTERAARTDGPRTPTLPGADPSSDTSDASAPAGVPA